FSRKGLQRPTTIEVFLSPKSTLRQECPRHGSRGLTSISRHLLCHSPVTAVLVAPHHPLHHDPGWLGCVSQETNRDSSRFHRFLSWVRDLSSAIAVALDWKGIR